MLRQKQLAAALTAAFGQKGLFIQLDIHSWLQKKGVTISQPTLSRLLGGNYHRAPKSLRLVCQTIGLDWRKFTKKTDPAKSILLQSALSEAWDGDADSERFLSRLITAAGEWIRSHDCTPLPISKGGVVADRIPSNRPPSKHSARDS